MKWDKRSLVAGLSAAFVLIAIISSTLIYIKKPGRLKMEVFMPSNRSFLVEHINLGGRPDWGEVYLRTVPPGNDEHSETVSVVSFDYVENESNNVRLKYYNHEMNVLFNGVSEIPAEQRRSERVILNHVEFRPYPEEIEHYQKLDPDAIVAERIIASGNLRVDVRTKKPNQAR